MPVRARSRAGGLPCTWLEDAQKSVWNDNDSAPSSAFLLPPARVRYLILCTVLLCTVRQLRFRTCMLPYTELWFRCTEFPIFTKAGHNTTLSTAARYLTVNNLTEDILLASWTGALVATNAASLFPASNAQLRFNVIDSRTG